MPSAQHPNDSPNGATASAHQLPLTSLENVRTTPPLDAIESINLADVLANTTPTDRYELGEEIARGGMGAVHRCHDRQLGRELAVKVLLPHLAHRTEIVLRFIEEARVAGQLQHPGIVPIHEFGRLADGRPFFAMKLVKGRTLANLLGERSQPSDNLPRFLKIFEQICQTLAYAHARKVIHRDLKPANVMVGAFGEVQVMDWGLAKVLSGSAEEPVSEPRTEEGTVVSTGRSTDPDHQTAAGSVMGTYAYMPPEQARGQTDRLDERADVFGLDGILCEILTGRPPYVATNAQEVGYQALAANLAPAWDRLDRCGADPELIRLARCCLAPEVNDRPPNAGVVAEVVAAYLASVADRLKTAEIDRAAAQARAQAERSKRRMTIALAGTVFAVAVLVGGSWAVLDQQHRARIEQTVQQAGQALGKAALLRTQADAVALVNLDRWREAEALRKEALAAAEQAEKAASTGEPDAETRQTLDDLLPLLRAEAEAVTRNRSMLERLEAIKFLANDAVSDDDYDRYLDSRGNEDRFIYSQGAGTAEYVRAFRDYGIDLEVLPAAEAAEVIRLRPIATELVAALDDWVRLTEEGPQRDTLLDVSRLADPDSLRDRLRKALASHDLAALRDLAQSPTAPRMTVSAVLLLAEVLFRSEEVPLAIALVRQAQRLNDGDFWLNNKLGEYLMYSGGTTPPRMEEAMRFFTAALVIRPQSQTARVNLADALAYVGAHEEAEAAYRQALEGRPSLAYVRNKLAAALAANGRYAEALKESLQAVEQRPQSAFIQEGLGGVCYMTGRYAEAEAAYRKAIALRPNIGSYHSGLGQSLTELGRSLDAVKSHREAVRLKPTATTYANLANTLVKRGEIKEALQAANEAVRRQPGSSTGLSGLANALKADGQMDRAVEVLRDAITVAPRDAALWWRLGTTLNAQNKYEEAAATVREAIRRGPEQGPRLALMYNELGLIRQSMGQLDLSVAAFQKAAALTPEDAIIQANLGDVWQEQKKYREAADAYRKAVDLKPENATFRSSLTEVLDRLDRIEEAAALWLNDGNPRDAAAVQRLAKLYQDHNQHRNALVILEPWLEKNAEDCVAWHRLGLSLEKVGRLDEAVSAYEKSLTGRSTPLMDYKKASFDFSAALMEQGRRLEKAGQLEDGRKQTARGYAYRGWAQNQLGKVKLAAVSYLQAAQLHPTEVKYYRGLAGCLKDTNPEAAILAYCSALAIDPRDSESCRRLGELLAALGRPAEAEMAFQIILVQKPGDYQTLLSFGTLLMETGRFPEALVAFKKAGVFTQTERCRHLLELEADLPAYLCGKTQPRDQDLLDLAELCRYKGMPAASSRFFADAMASRILAIERKEWHHAVLAAAEAGSRGDHSENERKPHRDRAFDWLRSELVEMMKSLTNANSHSAGTASMRLARWQWEPALAGVRDSERLAEMPDEERPRWQMFWAEVEALRQLADVKTH